MGKFLIVVSTVISWFVHVLLQTFSTTPITKYPYRWSPGPLLNRWDAENQRREEAFLWFQ